MEGKDSDDETVIFDEMLRVYREDTCTSHKWPRESTASPHISNDHTRERMLAMCPPQECYRQESIAVLVPWVQLGERHLEPNNTAASSSSWAKPQGYYTKQNNATAISTAWSQQESCREPADNAASFSGWSRQESRREPADNTGSFSGLSHQHGGHQKPSNATVSSNFSPQSGNDQTNHRHLYNPTGESSGCDITTWLSSVTGISPGTLQQSPLGQGENLQYSMRENRRDLCDLTVSPYAREERDENLQRQSSAYSCISNTYVGDESYHNSEREGPADPSNPSGLIQKHLNPFKTFVKNEQQRERVGRGVHCRFRNSNNRYNKIKIQKEVIDRTSSGLVQFLYINRDVINKRVWMTEITPRRQNFHDSKATTTSIIPGKNPIKKFPASTIELKVNIPSTQELEPFLNTIVKNTDKSFEQTHNKMHKQILEELETIHSDTEITQIISPGKNSTQDFPSIKRGIIPTQETNIPSQAQPVDNLQVILEAKKNKLSRQKVIPSEKKVSDIECVCISDSNSSDKSSENKKVSMTRQEAKNPSRGPIVKKDYSVSDTSKLKREQHVRVNLLRILPIDSLDTIENKSSQEFSDVEREHHSRVSSRKIKTYSQGSDALRVRRPPSPHTERAHSRGSRRESECSQSSEVEKERCSKVSSAEREAHPKRFEPPRATCDTLNNEMSSICKYYVKDKYCSMGRCPYSHRLPKEDNIVCRYYLLNTCSKGTACWFKHGDTVDKDDGKAIDRHKAVSANHIAVNNIHSSNDKTASSSIDKESSSTEASSSIDKASSSNSKAVSDNIAGSDNDSDDDGPDVEHSVGALLGILRCSKMSLGSPAGQKTVPLPAKATQQTVLLAKATQQTVLPAKATQQTVLPAKATQQTVLPAKATQQQTVLPAKATQQTVLPAKATQKTLLPAKATVQTVVSPSAKGTQKINVPSAKAIQKSVHPAKFIKNYLPPAKVTKKTEAPTKANQQTVPPTKATQQTVPPTKATQQTVPPTKASKQTVPPAEASQQTVPPVEASQQTVPPAEATQQTVPPAETTQKAVPLAKVTQQTVPSAKATQQTVLPAKATQQTVPPTEATQQTVPPAKATQQTVLPAKATQQTLLPAKATVQTVVSPSAKGTQKINGPSAKAIQKSLHPAKVIEKFLPPAKVIKKTVPPAEATEQTVPPAEATQQTVPPAEATQQTVPPAEATQQTVPPAKATQQTVPAAKAIQHDVPSANAKKNEALLPTVQTAVQYRRSSIDDSSNITSQLETFDSKPDLFDKKTKKPSVTEKLKQRKKHFEEPTLSNEGVKVSSVMADQSKLVSPVSIRKLYIASKLGYNEITPEKKSVGNHSKESWQKASAQPKTGKDALSHKNKGLPSRDYQGKFVKASMSSDKIEEDGGLFREVSAGSIEQERKIDYTPSDSAKVNEPLKSSLDTGAYKSTGGLLTLNKGVKICQKVSSGKASSKTRIKLKTTSKIKRKFNIVCDSDDATTPDRKNQTCSDSDDKTLNSKHVNSTKSKNARGRKLVENKHLGSTDIKNAESTSSVSKRLCASDSDIDDSILNSKHQNITKSKNGIDGKILESLHQNSIDSKTDERKSDNKKQCTSDSKNYIFMLNSKHHKSNKNRQSFSKRRHSSDKGESNCQSKSNGENDKSNTISGEHQLISSSKNDNRTLNKNHQNSTSGKEDDGNDNADIGQPCRRKRNHSKDKSESTKKHRHSSTSSEVSSKQDESREKKKGTKRRHADSAKLVSKDCPSGVPMEFNSNKKQKRQEEDLMVSNAKQKQDKNSINKDTNMLGPEESSKVMCFVKESTETRMVIGINKDSVSAPAVNLVKETQKGIPHCADDGNSEIPTRPLAISGEEESHSASSVSLNDSQIEEATRLVVNSDKKESHSVSSIISNDSQSEVTRQVTNSDCKESRCSPVASGCAQNNSYILNQIKMESDLELFDEFIPKSCYEINLKCESLMSPKPSMIKKEDYRFQATSSTQNSEQLMSTQPSMIKKDNNRFQAASSTQNNEQLRSPKPSMVKKDDYRFQAASSTQNNEQLRSTQPSMIKKDDYRFQAASSTQNNENLKTITRIILGEFCQPDICVDPYQCLCKCLWEKLRLEPWEDPTCPRSYNWELNLRRMCVFVSRSMVPNHVSKSLIYKTMKDEPDIVKFYAVEAKFLYR